MVYPLVDGHPSNYY